MDVLESISLNLVGMGSVGKTALVNQFMSHTFCSTYDPTIGDEYKASVDIKGKKVSVQIMDNAGNENAHFNINLASTQVLFVVFSLIDASSLKNAILELDKVQNYLNNKRERTTKRTKSDSVEPVIYLIGNKSDLVNERRVTREQADELIAKYSSLSMKYFETSAVTSTGLNGVFEKACTDFNDKYFQASSKSGKKKCVIV